MALSRRNFLATSGWLAGAALWADRATGALKQTVKLADHPFQLGVASGDPGPAGFVIWTRLAPKPLEGGGMPEQAVEVAWQVAEDEALTRIVARGTTVANPEWAHAVHVEVQGLKPERWYWYQFKAAGDTSPVGRARTMPEAAATPAKMKFAFASCQQWESGYYTAYEHMLKDELDLVCHLGDYIYEGSPGRSGVRRHLGPKLTELADFRLRHAQYKTDPALQAAHAACPWLVTWDDHELENNCAGEISQHKDATRESFLQLRTNAYKAYYEHMPLRRACLPTGPYMQLYRKVAFGRLAEFNVLDTRQYRSDQPCGDGTKPPCEGMNDPAATMLGDKQEQWLMNNLAKSPATWNVLAQQVMMARVDRSGRASETYSMDQWPGYEANRRRLLNFFREQKIANPVVIAGDIHSNWANNLTLDGSDGGSQSVASEFVGTSISSGGDGTARPAQLETTLAENPFVKFHNAQRGYVRCTLTPQSWQADFQVVDYVMKPGSPIHTAAAFIVEAGKAGLQQA